MSWLYPYSNQGSSHRRHRSKDRRHHSGSSSFGRHSHGRHSAPSLFNLGASKNYSMASSIFSTGSSSRRAKPRAGFIHRTIRRIKRLFRNIVHYAKRHPMKVFMMVIVPLITGGVLQKLLGILGVRLPWSLSKSGAMAQGLSSGGGGSGEGLKNGMTGLFSLAKMFL